MIADPGGRAPAPPPLRAVQRFVNTRDLENGVDELETSDALGTVLVELELLGPPDARDLTGGDLRRSLEVREALRALALVNNGAAMRREEVATLERAARAAHLTLAFADRARLVATATGIDGALGTLLASVHAAMLDGTWGRMKTCPRDVCGWLFYDRSRNASGRWCAMSVCGNRTHTKTYRRRRPRG